MIAYVGPGSGLALSVSLVTVAVVLLGAVLVAVLWPFAWTYRRLTGRRPRYRTRFRKAVVLGLDGLDPGLTREAMAAGRLPHMARLAARGHLSDLATTTPALTPAAWSSFSIGGDPSYHGIFDFVTRDPRTYAPRLSSAEVTETPGRALGPFRLPGRARVRGLRKGVPFWHALAERGVEVSVLRVPVTYPPEPFPGRLLSGLSVPDLAGSQGTFSVYTTSDRAPRLEGADSVQLAFEGGTARAWLAGPRLAGDGAPAPRPAGAPPAGRMAVPLTVARDGDPHRVDVRVGGARVALGRGQTSDWLPVDFRAGRTRVRGRVQLHLTETTPDLVLYASPVHIDAGRPATPISHPAAYGRYLDARLGPFGTLGLMEDTTALNEGVLDEQGFLQQAWGYFEERRAMLFEQLETGGDDVTICVFDTPDRIQHMFWRYREADHPARPAAPSPHAGAIDEMMAALDALVGDVAARLSDDTLLLVVSDHGFTSFQREVHLNGWLRANGYLHLRPGAEPGDWLAGVDWARTRAYALGLVGLFVNLVGREAEGIVAPGAEHDALLAELAAGLGSLTDPGRDGAPAVRATYATRHHFDGPYRHEGPDLLIGYAPGYRVSWATANGRVTDRVFDDNVKPWSGDHSVDPPAVPGVLLSNAPLSGGDRHAGPRLVDIAPTLLDLFGVPAAARMQGRSLLPGGGEGTGA